MDALMSAGHMLAAGVWAGGLTVLQITLLARSGAWAAHRAAVLRAYSPMAAISSVVLVATGVYQSGQHVPGLSSLFGTVYGAALVGKFVLVLVALGLAAVSTVLIDSEIARRFWETDLGCKGLRMPSGPRTMVRAVTAEVVVLGFAVLLGALLTSVPTAREVSTASEPSAPQVDNVDGLFLTFESVPEGVGRHRLILKLRSTIQPEPAPILGVDLTIGERSGPSDVVTLSQVEEGRFEGSTTALEQGRWHGTLRVHRQGLPDSVMQTRGDVVSPAVELRGPLQTVTKLVAGALLVGALLLLLRPTARAHKQRRTRNTHQRVELSMTAARTGWIAGLLAIILVCCIDTPGSYAGAPTLARGDPGVTQFHVRRRNDAQRPDLSKVTGRRAARRRKVIAQLKATAQTSQAGITANLNQWRGSSDVVSFTPLWATNSIAVTATPAVVASIAARGDVASVTPDRIRLEPARAAASSNLEAIHTPAVWANGSIGTGAVVASLDSGVDLSHPDLQDRWRGGTNSWFDPYGQHPTTPTDLMGHGTNVTGVMVAGDASGASLGVAPGSSWIAARVFDDSGSATISAVHQAFQWVLDPDQNPATDDAPQVVNASWSIGAGPGCDLTFQSDLAALRAADILPVFPAGNFGSGVGSSVSPANYPEALVGWGRC